MPSWLSKQRKQTLVDLAAEAGMRHDDDARREDLIEQLDEHLRKNATQLSSNTIFEGYYGTRRTPGRQRPSTAPTGTMPDEGEVKSVVRGRGKRPAKVKREQDETEAPAVSPSATVTRTSAQVPIPKRTPARPQQRSQLPPSPADVADEVEYATTRFYAGLDDFYSVSGIPETIDYMRDLCSSVTGVQLTCFLLEGYGLSSTILPWRYTGVDTPGFGIGLPHVPIYLPDFFMLLTPYFWSTSLLWAATSIFIPAVFGYFYNLTMHPVKRHGVSVTVVRYTADPLTFNVVKALLSYLVYAQGVTFGVVDPVVADRVSESMFGGYTGILIGSGICALATLYEAAQRR